ncbi:hypothetical protein IP97_01656 [Flavobacterium cheniae]|uniref:Uncharacterized protein n=1 Tax=Flavobacterium cheniae TaxID=295428 RepID=A0A562KFG3_9FLAO|nr:hypothetical protein C8D80_2263 [Flavobacterium cheniae]TWH94102.1 hypothetical protein IP97_01656 [Flavobacterium cheniae]
MLKIEIENKQKNKESTHFNSKNSDFIKITFFINFYEIKTFIRFN